MDKLTHAEKIRLAGIKKHGSEEKWREYQRLSGMKADRTTPRGFAVLPKDKVKEISQLGHKVRWAKKPQEQ